MANPITTIDALYHAISPCTNFTSSSYLHLIKLDDFRKEIKKYRDETIPICLSERIVAEADGDHADLSSWSKRLGQSIILDIMSKLKTPDMLAHSTSLTLETVDSTKKGTLVNVTVHMPSRMETDNEVKDRISRALDSIHKHVKTKHAKREKRLREDMEKARIAIADLGIESDGDATDAIFAAVKKKHFPEK